MVEISICSRGIRIALRSGNVLEGWCQTAGADRCSARSGRGSPCPRGRWRNTTGVSSWLSSAPRSIIRSNASFIDLFAARVRAIHLVDDDDDRQAELQRMLEHETGLRHRAFKRVDEQQHAVHHLQHALNLAAEVGVAGGIDDVDLHVRYNTWRYSWPEW